MINRKEILRQFIHLFVGSLVLLIPKAWDLTIIGTSLLITSLAGYIFVRLLDENAKKTNRRITKKAIDGTYKIINLAERKRVLTGQGAMLFFVGIGIALSIFSEYRDIAIMSAISLAVGDSMSTLIGVHLGSTKVWFNKKKSWEGALASFGGILIFGSFFLADFGAKIIFTAAIVGTLVELFTKKMDDNISIPLFTGLILFSLRSMGLV